MANEAPPTGHPPHGKAPSGPSEVARHHAAPGPGIDEVAHLAPFSVHAFAPLDDVHREPIDVSFRPADDQRWASLRFELPVIGADDERIIVKQWVNDWWPPTCPDLSLRSKGQVRWVPACSDTPGAEPRSWVVGTDHHGLPGAAAISHGTNVEVRFPESWEQPGSIDPRTFAVLSRLQLVRRGDPSWIARAYHPHRDVPDRGWGDGVLTSVTWAPFEAAPEDQGCPSPDLIDKRRIPDGWRIDATGARLNARLDHAERQWVLVDAHSGDPVVWARAVPMRSQHRYPLLSRADARYRLDWTETPLGWAGSLDPARGHHVVLLERGDIRIEVWIGLAASCTRSQAAELAEKLFHLAQ